MDCLRIENGFVSGYSVLVTLSIRNRSMNVVRAEDLQFFRAALLWSSRGSDDLDGIVSRPAWVLFLVYPMSYLPEEAWREAGKRRKPNRPVLTGRRVAPMLFSILDSQEGSRRA